MTLLMLAAIILLPIIPSYLLFMALPNRAPPSNAWAGGILYGMKVKFGGSFAGYFSVFFIIFSKLNIPIVPTPPPDPYQTWVIEGRVLDYNGNSIAPFDDKDVSLSPKNVRLDDDGRFSVSVTFQPGPNNSVMYPSLFIRHSKSKAKSFILDPSELIKSSSAHINGHRITFGDIKLEADKEYKVGYNTDAITPITMSER